MASTRAMRLTRTRQLLISHPEMVEGLPDAIASEFRTQQFLYDQYWQWMDGKVWDDIDKYFVAQKGKEPPLIFPVQLNPLYIAALIHRNSLFGEVPDSGGPMVRHVALPKVDAKGNTSDKARENAKFVGEVLEQIWYQSNGRSVMLDAGFVSQAIGGCVFKVSYEPWNQFLEPGLPIAFRSIEPEFFLPIASMTDRWNLLEARLGRQIDRYEAEEVYGVKTNSDTVLYLEVWKRNSVRVTINGIPAIRRVGNAEVQLSSEHNFGCVPFVYIPHESLGQFYGVPIVHQIGNLLKELNGRAADVGDAVRNSIERMYIATNTDAGDIVVTDLGDGIKVMATGREMAGTQPKRIEHVAPPDLPAGTMDFLKFLERQTWHAMSTPAVAYGEDEGSQRSALTLAFRMWPLTSHIRNERSLWTEGLRVMARMAMEILLKKQTTDFGDLTTDTNWKISKEHLGHRIMMDWAPMIPRDRESEVNQLILRHQDSQLSARTSISMMDDIPDPDREIKLIREEQEESLKMEAQYTVNKAPGSGNKQEGALSDNQPPIAKVEVE